jgi:hypothetical protein
MNKALEEWMKEHKCQIPHNLIKSFVAERGPQASIDDFISWLATMIFQMRHELDQRFKH